MMTEEGVHRLVHSGHRQRLKTRFRNEGLDTFEHHEVLELLLMYAIPQRDVNPLAHVLLDTFGSVSAVFEADPMDLESVPGMGRTSATLVSMIPALSRLYLLDRYKDKPCIASLGAAGEYCKVLFTGQNNKEYFYMVCMNGQYDVLHATCISQGTIDSTQVYPRNVVAAALRHNAHTVVLSHNHPAGSRQPSRADIEVTEMITRALDTIEVKMADHIIVTGNSFVSMNARGKMNKSAGQTLRETDTIDDLLRRLPFAGWLEEE